MESRKAQVTIFILIAVILVSLVIGFFLLKDRLSKEGLPTSVEPAYKSFLSCLEEETLVGVSLLESQAGYIELPNFEFGSEHMPFGSQLNFLGNPIPYWYYVSGNNIQKEQVPSRSNMEEQLGNFIEQKIKNCDFSSYYEQGFEINLGDPETSIKIKSNKIDVNLNMNMNFVKGEDNSIINSHKITVDSELGNLYDSAIKIYEKEQEELFLENYAVDILRLYAPVDGVELTCSPKIWNAEEIFDGLEEAIEANTLALKSEGGDYSLNEKQDEYFVIDLDVNEDVRFINSRNWAHGFEVSPSEESVLISKPVGSQLGLGILGFCYVPYHFVYNVRYPVLIQVYRNEEIFQFPFAVVIQGNNPREALDVSAVEVGLTELCQYKNNLIEVNTYDTNLKLVDSDISYECFGTTCSIGKTENGKLSGDFPQCANGYILARSEGFDDAKYLYSTNKEGSVDIIMSKLYRIDLNLKLDGRDYGKDAIISFISDKNSKTIIYPETKSVELSEGQYEIQVSVYRNSSIRLDATTHEQCVEIPKSGLGGLFGITEEKCFEIDIPSQVVSNALAGGGKENYYVLESELKNSNTLEINAESLNIPKSIEELQNNYILFENNDLDVVFK
ncbi:MAG: hypothetical protein ABH811_00610 [archaeon]